MMSFIQIGRLKVGQAYLSPASMVCWVLCPSSFSCRLIRVAAADRPMTAAKMGSPAFEMRWAGEGILSCEVRRAVGGRFYVNVRSFEEDWSSVVLPESPNESSTGVSHDLHRIDSTSLPRKALDQVLFESSLFGFKIYLLQAMYREKDITSF